MSASQTPAPAPPQVLGPPAPCFAAPAYAALPMATAGPSQAADAGAAVFHAPRTGDTISSGDLPPATNYPPQNFVFAAAMQHRSPLPPANSARLDFPAPLSRRSSPHGPRQDRHPAPAQPASSWSPHPRRSAGYPTLNVTGGRSVKTSDSPPPANSDYLRTVVPRPAAAHQPPLRRPPRTDAHRNVSPPRPPTTEEARTDPRRTPPTPAQVWRPTDADTAATLRRRDYRGYQRRDAPAHQDDDRHAPRGAHSANALPPGSDAQRDTPPAPDGAAPPPVATMSRPGPSGNPPTSDITTALAGHLYATLQREHCNYAAHLQGLGTAAAPVATQDLVPTPLLDHSGWGAASTPTSSQDTTPLSEEARAARLPAAPAPVATPPRPAARDARR